MTDFMAGIVGETLAPAASLIFYGILIIGALIGLAALVRRMTNGTYIAGGHNRRPRLAVMDATAVDTKRRLVLVRRDDIEHLILIGGAADIVVEQNIRMSDRLNAHLPEEAPVYESVQDVSEDSERARPQQPLAPIAPATAAVASTAAFSKVEAAPDADIEPEAKPEPVTRIEPEPVTNIEPEPEARIEPEPVTKIEPEPEARIEPGPEEMKKIPDGSEQPGIDSALLDELEESLEIDDTEIEKPDPSEALHEEVEVIAAGKRDPVVEKPSPERSAPPIEPAPVKSGLPDPTPEQDLKPARNPAGKPASNSNELEDEMEKLLRELSAGSSR